MSYSKHFSTKSTPQNEPIPGSNQIANNAGGFGFEISEEKQLERFLVLGSEGRTYYTSEAKLTKDNATKIVSLIQKDGIKVVQKILEMRDRVPKNQTLTFTLALVTTFGNQEAKQAAYRAIQHVCTTSTQLFDFVQNIQDLRGWSRGLRNGVAKFYTERNDSQLAYQLVKYRQRNGWTHSDVLRLAHAVPGNPTINQLLRYAVGKTTAEETGSRLVQAFAKAQTMTSGQELAKHILSEKLSWEMVPTEMLKNNDVQLALLQHMPSMALVRNLGRMTATGLLEGNSETIKLVVKKLAESAENLHPFTLLNALKVYSQGHGDKGSLSWNTNQKVVDALDSAFEASFGTLKGTGKNILLGIDISGSMSAPVLKTSLTAREVAAAMMLATLKSEPNAEVVWFDTKLHSVKAGARTSYQDILEKMPHGGGTDLSLPMLHALATKQKYDAIVTYTDNETWSGNQHPVQAYDKYKKTVNNNVKGVLVCSAANNISVLPESDLSTLGTAGFDSAVPELITNFIK